MAKWTLIGEGSSLDNIEAKVSNRELPKGTGIKVEMSVPWGTAWIFDVVGNWDYFAIAGTDVVDVYGEGTSKGVVILESDPVWIAGIIAFIGANWKAILISGLMLGALVTMVRIFAWIAGPGFDLVKLAVIGGVALVGVYAYQKIKGPSKKGAK